MTIAYKYEQETLYNINYIYMEIDPAFFSSVVTTMVCDIVTFII